MAWPDEVGIPQAGLGSLRLRWNPSGWVGIPQAELGPPPG
eukprot:CAMPEP_0181252578 /NCGR_PEP_ID=MMETSP1096-20121128/47542_1 /TAXON_ID=156174 ORGANISM="Chrysochromulina ericina, Strain CCMP281" /NCGR_SAMPLE_ID=MMETSP1096 /ASSEMBLY_ACC=CAM_ASM_000453 /LENGTH=39 /DNA_ID= /DNA_START= /DNA_END= /DNA_ORIENTATION=